MIGVMTPRASDPAPSVELDVRAADTLRRLAWGSAAESMRFAADDLDRLAALDTIERVEIENAKDACRIVLRDLALLDALGWPDLAGGEAVR